MKYLAPQIIYLLQNQTTRRNFVILAKFLLFIAAMVCLYSILFHVIMLHEGRNFSWITGFYWTLTVMSTLGFGDITFHTDLGLFFTMLVLLSGVIFLLIMLPFTFIQFFYAPLLEAQKKARTPRKVAADIRDHVIITGFDPVTAKLIRHLQDKGTYYVLITDDVQHAAELHDLGYNVVVGDTGSPETYENVRVRQAALVVANHDDLVNTNIAFTIRELTADTPIATNADNEHSIDILEYPGNMQVFQFMKMLGQSMGSRTIGIHHAIKIIGRQDSLLIAEIPAILTSFKDKRLVDVKIRETSGVTVVGIWDKGKFVAPLPHTVIHSTTVLLLAGSEEQLEQFDRAFSVSHDFARQNLPVLILGGGRVGMAAAEVFAEEKLDYRIVEKRAGIVAGSKQIVQGDAADINVLKEAGIGEAGSVLVTTHDDAMNIYLTFYCRQIRPDVQIISRANNPGNVNKLHTAGADLVMSYASMVINSINNLLRPGEASVVMEGLNMFTVKAGALAGKSLIESRLREQTGCNVAAVRLPDGEMLVGPDPALRLQAESELILMGTDEAERKYLELYG